MKGSCSIFQCHTQLKSIFAVLLLAVVVFKTGEAELFGTVQAKVGSTANFTWMYGKFGFKDVTDITLATYKSGAPIRKIARFGNSKMRFNPSLEAVLKERIEFTVDAATGIAIFLFKNIKDADENKEFGIEISTVSSSASLVSKLEIVEEPKFDVKPVARTLLNEGEKLELNCKVTGKPLPKIEWVKKDSNTVIATGAGSKALVFESITKFNQSDYECIGSNVAGRVSQSAEVIVFYRPVIDTEKSSKTAYSYVGNPNTVTLKCVADARPPPSYYWKDNFGLNVSYEATYSIVNPKDAQLGFSYRCFASNKVGTSDPYPVKVVKLEKPGVVTAELMAKTSRSLMVQWNLPNDTGGAALVSVVVGLTGPSGKSLVAFKPETTNNTFKGLQPFSDYKLEFVTKNQVLESLPTILEAKTGEEAPSAPLELKSPEREASVKRQLKINWKAPKHKNGIIRYYEVAFGPKVADSYNVETAEKLRTNETKLTLMNLTGYMPYLIQVRAMTTEPGPWSKPLKLLTAMEAPTEPRNISCQNVSPTRVFVLWKRPQFIYGSIAAAEARIKYDFNGKQFVKVKRLAQYPLTRVWRLEVFPFTSYQLEIREGAGVFYLWGPYSKPCFFRTMEGVPTMPVNTRITHRTTRTISLSWQRPERINGILTHFVVFYENATRRYQERISHDLSNKTFLHRIGNLNLATKYTIIVQAHTAVGGGTFSETIETETNKVVASPLKKPNDEIAAGPIIGGIFSFLVILVLLIILILYIARKQRQSKNANIPQIYDESEESPPPDQRLLPPPGYEEKVPDVVTTNGQMPVDKRNSCHEKPTKERSFLSSRPIKLDELKDVCDRLHANKDAGFIQEFKGLTPRVNDLTLDISLRLENKCKNRYNNILAYDHSRVILSYIENIPGSDYINANYVDGYSKKNKFIATQGPVAASFNDFWRMVWEQNADIIVMVTNLIEKSRIKCQKYWPTGDPREYGSIRVTPEEEMELAEYVVRKFSISMVSGNKRHGSRKVTQYQFTGWPDHGVPQYATNLLQFIRKIRLSAQDCAGPIICHCSAGVGRTGTFLTLDSMLDQIKAEGTVDVHGYVTHIKAQRNFLVQTEAQYIFVHDALLEAVICGDTEITVKDLARQIKSLQQVNPESGKTLLHEEFERLSYNLEENHVYEAGYLEVNSSKNRFSSIVPIEATRLKLWPYPKVEGSDYINANFVDGYQQREAFILTQAPMENTVEDFWRMIWEYEVFSIVMLSSAGEHDESHCFPYWPYNSEPANIGLLIIQIAAEENKNGFVKREFRATNSNTGETRVVTHFMYYDWPEDKSPEDPSFIIAMIGQLQKAQQLTGNGSVAVHCSDGCGRSGTIAAVIFCIERLKVEGIVDVFQTVRMMRTQRPHVIRSLDHYLFSYNAVMTFVDKFSNYSNFK